MTQILDANRVFVAGVGRSGLVMRSFAMRLMHMGLTAHIVGYETTPAISAGDLLLLGSGSGTTASLLAHGKKARQVGAGLTLITTQGDSPLARLVDLVLVIPAPTPKTDSSNNQRSVQPMASLFEQSMLLTLDALSMMLMERLELDDGTTFLRHANLE
jgi:6-phospho-3-hexuloisomerase